MNSTNPAKDPSETEPAIGSDMEVRTIRKDEYPLLMREARGMPRELRIRGSLPPDNLRFLTVVGSRRFTEYGRKTTRELVTALRGLPVVIVSGLAYGIDSVALGTAISVGLKAIGVPGSGLSERVLAPAASIELSRDIVRGGGALLSPFPDGQAAAPWTFPRRNPIMAALSHATLVIEAELDSGTLITAKSALDADRDVLAVPGPIHSPSSAGCFYLLRNGAALCTRPSDILSALGFDPGLGTKRAIDRGALSADELQIVDLLAEPMTRDELANRLGFDVARASAAVSLLEIKGLVEERLGKLQRA